MRSPALPAFAFCPWNMRRYLLSACRLDFDSFCFYCRARTPSFLIKLLVFMNTSEGVYEKVMKELDEPD